jgi:hypothetical protein
MKDLQFDHCVPLCVEITKIGGTVELRRSKYFYLAVKHTALRHQSVVRLAPIKQRARRDKERRRTKSAFHSSCQLLKRPALNAVSNRDSGE